MSAFDPDDRSSSAAWAGAVALGLMLISWADAPNASWGDGKPLLQAANKAANQAVNTSMRNSAFIYKTSVRFISISIWTMVEIFFQQPVPCVSELWRHKGNGKIWFYAIPRTIFSKDFFYERIWVKNNSMIINELCQKKIFRFFKFFFKKIQHCLQIDSSAKKRPQRLYDCFRPLTRSCIEQREGYFVVPF